MRITAQAKETTRARIIDVARKLFKENGLDGATTRDVAAAAGIATGTLFNYFPSKEALAAELVNDSLADAADEFHDRRSGATSLEEELFLLAATAFRHLRSHRSYLPAVLELSIGVVSELRPAGESDNPRLRHLDAVADIIRRRTGIAQPSVVTLHLYWSLFVGVAAFWSRDGSPNQEETLVMLDQATRALAGSIVVPKVKE